MSFFIFLSRRVLKCLLRLILLLMEKLWRNPLLLRKTVVLVPCKGDEFVFDGDVYEITKVTWINKKFGFNVTVWLKWIKYEELKLSVQRKSMSVGRLLNENYKA